MKKLLALIALVLALTLLVACGTTPAIDDPPTSEPTTAETTIELTTTEALSETEQLPATEESPAPAVFDGAWVLKFCSANGPYAGLAEDAFSPEYTPKLVMDAATGKFTWTLNLLEGMGEMTGSFAANGDKADFTVASKNFSGFEGDGITAFSMELVDGYLVYNGAPCCSCEAGDKYAKE